jgi:ribosomal protein RSM22 (predicted rRNA methylase)
MQWRCRQEVEDVLWAAARAQLPAMALERKRLLQAITERTALYTTEREGLRAAARDDMPSTDLAARSLFFGVADAAKISIPLHELAGRNLLPPGESWRILDLGAGGGAMGLGLLSYAADHHPGLSVQIDAVDLDDKALAIYSEAIARAGESSMDLGAVEIRTHASSALDFTIAASDYDLIILGSMLNELSESERTTLASGAMQGVNAAGALIIIEPALRETSRALHRVRDSLIEGRATIFAPCTRAAAPCPALSDERDWCHEDRAGVLPDRARQMAQSTGLRDGGLKFSYLVARHGGEPLVQTEGEELALRVVSQPQRGKGQRECFACSECGRQRVRLLKRNRNSGNRLFDRAKRGDVLLTTRACMSEGERHDVARDQPVTLCRPASLASD